MDEPWTVCDCCSWTVREPFVIVVCERCSLFPKVEWSIRLSLHFVEWSIPGIWFYMDRTVHIISGRLIIYVHMSFIFSSIVEILDIWFLYVLQKRRAPKNDEECPDFRAEISHMRPIQGQKLKLFITPFCGVINSWNMILYGPYGPYNIWKVDNICTHEFYIF